MSEKVETNLLLDRAGRKEIIIGLSISAVFGAGLALIGSPFYLAVIFLTILGGVAFLWGYQYIPLAVFLQLAFSVELQITGTTRLTVPSEVLIPVLFLMFAASV